VEILVKSDIFLVCLWF